MQGRGWERTRLSRVIGKQGKGVDRPGREEQVWLKLTETSEEAKNGGPWTRREGDKENEGRDKRGEKERGLQTRGADRRGGRRQRGRGWGSAPHSPGKDSSP